MDDVTNAPTNNGTKSNTTTTAKTTIPSVKDSVVKAIDHLKRENLFAYPAVEIAASKQRDGSVKVLFSVPTSDVMVTAGRKATKPIFLVLFSKDGVSSERQSLEGLKAPDRVNLQSDNEALAAAASAICSQGEERDEMEFAVSVSRDGEGFYVTVESVPYFPGGHTGYKLSKQFEILEDFPGL